MQSTIPLYEYRLFELMFQKCKTNTLTDIWCGCVKAANVRKKPDSLEYFFSISVLINKTTSEVLFILNFQLKVSKGPEYQTV